MVCVLYNVGIEVILDVVYNYMNEVDDEYFYFIFFCGIDNLIYYIVDLNNYVQFVNYGGCGNIFNCNYFVVMQFILDSFCYWVIEYYIDGFWFDFVSIFCCDIDGKFFLLFFIVKVIVYDFVLRNIKLIVEFWDCGGLYFVGYFFNWDRWVEWNGKYCDDV